MTDVISVVEGLDFVVSLAAGQVHPEDVDAARRVSDQARSRAGHLGGTLVMALVGGTGSGKSSLLNALAGSTVASVSPVRPHTTEPLAWIPSPAEPSLIATLDRLAITDRVAQDRFANLAILDMMDIDSVAVEHRHRVEELLPDIDAVMWVLDPVKYSDPVLHREFITPLATASDRVIFVLNQVDLLDDLELTRVRSDLRALLERDGIVDPTVFEVAADPAEGEPRGVTELAAHLGARLAEKRIHIGKIVDDARAAARSVATAAGVDGGGSLEFEQRWVALREAIVTDVMSSGDAAAFEESLRLMEGLILALATEAGGGFGLRMRQTFRTDWIESQLRSAIDAALGADGAVDRVLDDELQTRFGVPIREILWERASLAAVVAGLAVDASQVDLGLGRHA